MENQFNKTNYFIYDNDQGVNLICSSLAVCCFYSSLSLKFIEANITIEFGDYFFRFFLLLLWITDVCGCGEVFYSFANFFFYISTASNRFVTHFAKVPFVFAFFIESS